MFPLKWKIFRIVSYIHLAIVCIITCLLLYFSIDDVTNSHLDWGTFLAIILIVIVCGGVLIANSSINLYLLERYYPDKNASKGLYDAQIVMFIISIFLILIFLLIWGYSITLLMERSSVAPLDFRQMIPEAIIVVIIFTGIFILALQTGLRKTIRRNHAKTLDSFLETEK